ncbi:dockerin type I domain-containing protein [Blastopirellula sp. JC732]|uniref:Dockerin type I domain-containing protein n=1 Tax=Blastopirellula sediminis TaxID=2894196 RepID=A0A9X1MUY7_9BACT|nr:dockerin type I domain-containing protein [Blastopirellula sediminis]MCC9604612.1 dockerin type I domain-containing protein [Blastopirellula sediminis]MCC9632089.1 dockerin type I domain-containing protein [Blastopirellula sediminis]
MMAADLNAWHNANMSHDVNGDEVVDQTDLQILVSQLELGFQNYMVNSQAAGGLEGEQVLYLDVNNDGAFNPLDLNSMLSSLIEGEDADSSYSAAFTFEIYQNGMLVDTADTTFDMANMPVMTPVNINLTQDTFTLKVYMRNTSALTGGAFTTPDVTAAYLDISFDSTIVQPVDAGTVELPFDGSGGVPTSISTPGLIAHAGGNSSVANTDLIGAGWEEMQMLYTVDFTPTQAGTFMLQGSKAVFDDPVTPSINLAAVLFQDAVGDGVDAPLGQPLDIVNLAFPKFNITILPVPGANNDLVDVSADLVNEMEASDPRIVDIGGVKYLAIDVKANDLDFNGNLLTDGSEVILTPGGISADTSLTTNPDLVSRVMITNQLANPVAGFKDEFLLYRLPTDLSGTESFFYTLTDATDPMTSNMAKVTINISAAAVAVDDGDAVTPFAVVEVNESQNLDVLANDFVAGDGQAVSIDNIIITGIADDSGTAVADGRVVIAADMKSIDYTASATPGLETFTYTITYVDDAGDPVLDASGMPITDTATVTIRVPIHSLITGQLFFDVNNDQEWDDNANNNASPEQFIGGVQVTLYQGGVVVGTAFSSEADGTFRFAGIDEGTYSVKVTQPKFVYKYGTAMNNPLPAGWTILADGSVMINNLTISANALEINGLNLGYVGRTGPYRGIMDQLSQVGENSITFAVSKQANGTGKLEWYSPDQGWSELVSIDGFLFNSATKSGQFIMHIDEDGDDQTPEVIAPVTFSPNHPDFLLIADTSDAVIFMLTGDIRTIVDHLSTVDVAFTDI